MTKEEALEFLEEMGAELARQDNAMTAAPVWLVETTERFYGVDTSRMDPAGTVRVDECGDEDPDGEEVAYVNQKLLGGPASLTRRGIEEYIERDGHNRHHPRPYAVSLHRCPEMIKLREALMALAKPLDEKRESPYDAIRSI